MGRFGGDRKYVVSFKTSFFYFYDVGVYWLYLVIMGQFCVLLNKQGLPFTLFYRRTRTTLLGPCLWPVPSLSSCFSSTALDF
jgi:hypothetical protein